MADAETLPSGWAWARLGDVCEVNPATDISHLSRDDTVAFVPMAAVAELSNQVDTSRRRPLHEVVTGFTRFAPGDVLFAKITPCMENGKIALVPEVAEGVAFGSTEFHVLRCGSGVEPPFIRHFLAQQRFRDFARGAMSGAVGQQRVPAEFVRDAPIPLPSSGEQARIVTELKTLFAELDEAEAALARARESLTQFRASLLHAACTGVLTAEWRAANPARETGADLLRRILAERRAAWERAERARMEAKGKPLQGNAWKTRYVEPVGPHANALLALPDGWAWASVDQLSEGGRSLAYGVLQPGQHIAGGVP